MRHTQYNTGGRSSAITSLAPCVDLADRTVARMALTVIKIYKWTLSPWLGRQCRFYPTCSSYAIGAIELHGGLSGSWLALKRLARCHPFHEGGVDEVPPHSCTNRANNEHVRSGGV